MSLTKWISRDQPNPNPRKKLLLFLTKEKNPKTKNNQPTTEQPHTTAAFSNEARKFQDIFNRTAKKNYV